MHADRIVVLGLVGASLACTSASPEPNQVAEVKTEAAVAPEPAPKPRPQPAPEPKPGPDVEPPKPAPSELRVRIEDLAVVRDGELLGSGGVQCWGSADWAAPSDLARSDEHPVKPGDRLYAIAASGVSQVKARARANHEEIEVESKTLGSLLLATKNFEPPARVRLEPRRLGKPGADVAPLAAWIEARVPYEVSAIGEIDGAFGGGVDRIVVFEPKQWQGPPDPSQPEDEEAEWQPFLRSEIALLVAGDRPQGWLPFGAPADDEDGVWDSGAFGLQVFGVLDLDGDKTLEVAWLTQMPWGDPLTTAVTISYYDGARGFDVRDVGGCSYNGCEAFLPRKRCRGIVKPRG